MAKRKKRKEDEVLIDIAEVSHDAQTFYERNEKIILGVVGGIIGIVVGILGYHNMYKLPREKEATAELYYAEQQFALDSFESALADPGAGHLGLIDIAHDYSGTPAGNMANYYAGVSFLKLGKFENAIDYMKQFDAKGSLLPIMKFGVLGDAYSELEDFDKAISAYQKAVSAGDNNFLTPYYLKKLGLLHEHRGNTDKALQAYNKIKAKYQQSADGYNIDKYIAKVANDY